MNFELTQEQLSIQETVRKFVEKEVAPGVLERDEKSEFPMAQYKKMGELGLMGLQYPKEYGGQGLDYMAYVLTVVELSKVDSALAISYSVSASLFSGALIPFASEEQKKKYLPMVLSGKAFGCFALTEPNAGSDVSAIATTAVKDGNDYILNGSKCFITNGPLADYAMVIAKTSEEGGPKALSAFIVETKTKGFSVGRIENKMGIRSAQVSEIQFQDCRVPKENMMGDEGDGFKIAMTTLDGGRVGVASQALGIAKGAFNIAIDYMKERRQFGKPLYKNQYLAFKMADLGLMIDQAELMLAKAATMQSEGGAFGLPASKAKLLCTDAAMAVTTHAVQMLGGNGYMKDYHVERLMRDAKITQIYEGANEVQRLIISNSLFH